jgi:hypothetical protein
VAHLEATSGLQQHFHRYVRGAVDAGRRVDIFVRLCFRRVEHVLERFPRQVGVDHQHVGVGAQPRDRRELVAPVDWRAAEQRVDLGYDRDADQRAQHGVAVGRRVGAGTHADRAGSARPVLQDERLLELPLDRRQEGAQGDVGDAAGREGDDDLDRPVGETLGLGGERPPEQQNGKHGE